MIMAGRKRKPVELHIHDPKKTHLGAEDLAQREEAEVSIGEFRFTPCPDVKRNKEASKKWAEITGIYKAAEDQISSFVSSSDNGILNRYCALYGEYFDLIRKREKLAAFELPYGPEPDPLFFTPEEMKELRVKKLFGILEYMTSLNALLRLESTINAKAREILHLEDRIFLNPAAKVRTLPIKRKNKRPGRAETEGFNV